MLNYLKIFLTYVFFSICMSKLINMGLNFSNPTCNASFHM
jgi:hypothetical protein